MRHVFLTSRLDADHGGLTASLLRKAGTLQRHLGIEPTIATFHDAVDFAGVADAIRVRYDLPAAVRLVNINHAYRARPAPAGAPPGGEALDRLCADLPEWEIRRMDDADRSPYAATVTSRGTPVRRVWFRADGTIFEYRNLAPGGLPADGARGRAPYPGAEVVLDPLTPAEVRFKTMDGFRRHYMLDLCQDALTYLVCEGRGLDKALIGLESRFARKLFLFHSTHLRPDSEVVRVGNRALLAELGRADALVLLTPQQREDIAARFGFCDRLRVIPHAAAAAAGAADPIPGRVVMVARLSPEKDIAAAIRAFAQVARVRPDASLEIWGDGPEEAHLRRLVQELGLDGAVRLAGYAPGAAAAFAAAECSLLTSRWEGFPLTIMESMAVGTPCVAFDVKYGPAAMIEHGVSGYLAPARDEAALAERLIGLLNAPPPAKRAMSQAARERAEGFSEAALAERWAALFESLRHPLAARPHLVKRLWRRVPPGPRNRLGALLGV
ncbi:MAG: glycosyltransferase [Bifidobacteriaceae bacterium]|nr:glycosyltransferase [Bifidobacteriaceae bacterium]